MAFVGIQHNVTEEVEAKRQLKELNETLEKRVNKENVGHLTDRLKSEIKEESIYDNSQGSVLLFRCRTNTMPLNNRNRHTNSDTSCPCCNFENEDLNHFLLHCPAYSSARRDLFILQQPYIEQTDAILQRLLLFSNEPLTFQHDAKKLLCKMYLLRKKKIESVQN